MIVVPSPPETDWPLISSKPVMPAIASRKTAAVLTRMGFQGHRETGRPALSTSAAVATGSGEAGATAAVGGVTVVQPSTSVLVDTVVTSTPVSPTRPTNAEASLSLVCLSDAV